MQTCLIEHIFLIDHLSDVLLPVLFVFFEPFIQRAFRAVEHLVNLGNLLFE